jgi:hypothetical protein
MHYRVLKKDCQVKSGKGRYKVRLSKQKRTQEHKVQGGCEKGFVSILDIARERKCNVRTVLSRIKDGEFPPLPVNQQKKYRHFRLLGWPRATLEAFFTEQGRLAAQKNIKN